MIRIALQTCLTVMAFLFSVSGTLASGCEKPWDLKESAKEVTECSNETLCRIAIDSHAGLSKGQRWRWNTDLFLRYKNTLVTEAKKREITFESMKTCSKPGYWCGHICTWPGKKSNSVASQKPNTVLSQTANLFKKNDFDALNSTKRKQLQYGLKKLGYYTSSIDGKYGPNTQRAVRGYAKAKGITSGYPNSVHKRIVSDVNVPSSFAAAPQSSSSSSSSTKCPLKTIVSSPSQTCFQAHAICRPQAEAAEQAAKNSYRPPKGPSNYSARCRETFSGNYNCTATENTISGGFLGGVANALSQKADGVNAGNRAYDSCLAIYGWKR